MKEVRYIGLFDRVEVTLPDGTRAHVDRGKTLKTTAEHANQLVETTTDSWRHVKRSAAPKKKPAGKAAPRASAPAEPSSKEE